MRQALKNKGFLAVLFTVFLLTARWIWLLANNWDFGFSYESAARIARGEMFGRDFYVTIPLLSSYTEALFVWLFRGNVWSEQVNVYLWWFACLAVGCLLVLKVSRLWSPALACGLVSAAILSAPPFSSAIVYNYAATTLAGLAFYFTLCYLQDRTRISRLFLAGISAGLLVLAKQNVGALIGFFLGAFLLVDLWFFSRQSPKHIFLAFGAFAVGSAISFGVPFFYWASGSSADNIFKLFFTDAASVKGGFGKILQRALPKIAIPDLRLFPRYHLIQGPGTILVLGGMIYWCWRRSQKDSTAPGNLQPHPVTTTFLPVNLVLLFLSVLSLFAIPALSRFGDSLARFCLFHTTGFSLLWGQLFYLLLFAIAFVFAFSLFRDWWRNRNKGWMLTAPLYQKLFLLAALAALGSAVSTSSLNYIMFAVPLVVPLLVCELNERMGVSLARVNICTIVMTISLFLYAYFNAAFVPLRPLPSHSPFAGLYGTPLRHEITTAIWQNITPRIRSGKTLWLCNVPPGAPASYQAVFTPSLIAAFKDTHSVRVQELLFKRWNNAPLPEHVVRSTVIHEEKNLPPGTRVLEEKFLTRWLQEHYTNSFNLAYNDGWTLHPSTLEVWDLK